MLAQAFLRATASRMALLSYPLSASSVAPSGMASNRASASWLSWTCPPVSRRATGRPSASTRAWILLVRPPRERPMPRSPAPHFARRTVLVDADTGGVDHDDLAFEGDGNRRKPAIPHPGFAPANEPVVAGRRWAVTFVYLGPWRAAAEAPENAVQDPPVINPRNTARLVGQPWLDDRPFPIRQFVSPPCHQASIAMESLNHTQP